MEDTHDNYAWSGQMEAFMVNGEFDPAAAPKAGSDKPMESAAADEEPNHHDDDHDEESEKITTDLLDESKFVSLIGSKEMQKHGQHGPPAFFTRDIYCKLNDHGLVSVPPCDGFILSYHNSTCQWHGRCSELNKNYAPTWGALRTEEQALLAVIEQLWKWFLELNPDNMDGAAYLERIQGCIKELSKAKDID